MTYDDFVSRILILDFKIDQQLDKAERLRAICDRCTTIWSDDMKVQSSVGKTREDHLTELLDSKGHLEDLLKKRKKAEEEITDFFNSALKPRDANIMIMKYVNGKSVKEISKQLFYSYSGVATRISRAEVIAKNKYYERNKDNERKNND